MRLMRWLPLALAVTLAGCGTTRTVTQTARPSNGPIRAEAKADPIPSQTNYRPKHGNAEHAVFRSGGGCGVERWAVKTLTDPLAGNVTLTPQQTTIADLVSIAPPINPTDRINPTEETTFQLSGTITFVKQEADSDYHIVVKDTAGNTMIVESTAPSCASGSRVLAQIEQVRQAVEAKFPPGGVQTVNVPATVTGIGFFDRLHGQTGVAPSGIELHPLIAIRFG
jgi:hypothetical protein